VYTFTKLNGGPIPNRRRHALKMERRRHVVDAIKQNVVGDDPIGQAHANEILPAASIQQPVRLQRCGSAADSFDYSRRAT